MRTDESNKHNGITFILVDMKTPGIEVKPIRLISGNSPFCETFLTDVVAPVKNVVGAVNGGWTVAKTLLNFERSGMGTGSMGGPRRGGQASGAKLIKLAKESAGERDGKLADGELRERLAGVLLDEMALGLTTQRSAESRKAGGAPGPEISMFKLYASELGHRRDELTLSIRRSAALGWDGGRQRGCDAGARLARSEGDDDLRRHVRDAAQHHRQARARLAGLERSPCDWSFRRSGAAREDRG